ncbi:MAG: DUF1851 domain-containing protein [Planctomycetaceae bacterium]|nr:DUF1851 domain-containing protein [Planctomycetaceae bacterium]
MPITLNDLTISPSEVDLSTLLADWEWAMGESMTPVLITAMGDVFAQGETRRIFFIDTSTGQIEKVAENGDEFQNLLRNANFVTAKMYPALVLKYRKAGIELGPGEVYSYSHPLALGGDDSVDNIAAVDVVVHVSISGQIHRQIKDLPEGTDISEVRFE